ncbi:MULTISPECIES: carbohydrate-binding protein [unclassified Streptomyces]|uniref:dioxygenase family protein n=1 Tax=unclassified Streptomyces TaxID=2593676 RepID=UPI0006FE9041|nr:MULTISPECIES: carbohydrate-binding protein [unclassified Streptomyces]KQX59243.1 dioxygenase [Streptomyces sp. Root1304]KRB00504.1 dioxygenase [Streptomyces sp. Root66D1]
MDSETSTGHVTRKAVLRAALAAGMAAPVALMGVPALARTLTAGEAAPALTPECDDGDDPTPPQMEGPYFKPNSPLRTSLLESGTAGVRLTFSGYVFGLACRPISGVLLDFWQADTNGGYDNSGFRFRGHQFTDAQGAFKLTTIVPGLYPGRTRHLHVKIQAPGRPVLTTQLYFPGEPRNNTDSLFDARLLMNVRDAGAAKEAAFDFVLNVPQDPGPSPTPTATATTQPPGGTWAAGTAYRAGDRVTYGGLTYVCLQAHTGQTGWEPPYVPALWQAL